MPISRALAVRSISRLAETLDPDEAAEGVIRLVNDSMARAMSLVSVERGRDPRDFTLIAFGGAGPGHACDVAEELGVAQILVPAHAGLFSAYGLLAGEFTRTFSDPVMGGARGLQERFQALEASVSEEMKSEGFDDFEVERLVEARYSGQSHELLIPYEAERALRKTFDAEHRALFGYSTDDEIEVVNIKVRAKVPRNPPALTRATPVRGPAVKAERVAWIGGRLRRSWVHPPESLSTGECGTGPCIIEEYDSTLVVNPGWTWTSEEYGTRLTR